MRNADPSAYRKSPAGMPLDTERTPEHPISPQNPVHVNLQSFVPLFFLHPCQTYNLHHATLKPLSREASRPSVGTSASCAARATSGNSGSAPGCFRVEVTKPYMPHHAPPSGFLRFGYMESPNARRGRPIMKPCTIWAFHELPATTSGVPAGVGPCRQLIKVHALYELRSQESVGFGLPHVPYPLLYTGCMN